MNLQQQGFAGLSSEIKASTFVSLPRMPWHTKYLIKHCVTLDQMLLLITSKPADADYYNVLFSNCHL
jgi:hypothetical protein